MFSPDVLRVFCARIARAQKSPCLLYQKQGLEQRPKVSPNVGDLEGALLH